MSPQGPKGDRGRDGSSGGTCFGCVATLLLLCAIFFGLATPRGTFHIDFFPPAIRLEGAAAVTTGGGE